MTQRFRLALPLALALLFADCTTKELAQLYLAPEYVPHRIIGDVLQFTLAYNRGSAMSLAEGSAVRWLLVVVSLVLVVMLGRLAWTSPSGATLRRIGLGLIIGGALGNLASRMWSSRGVVDFIDIGVGARRFWVFNVADIGVTIGACMLALAIHRTSAVSPEPAD